MKVQDSLSEQPSVEASNSEVHGFGGSCPDLSDSQLMLWDNYLVSLLIHLFQRNYS